MDVLSTAFEYGRPQMLRSDARRRGYSQQVGGYLYTVYFLLILLIGILKSTESRFGKSSRATLLKLEYMGKWYPMQPPTAWSMQQFGVRARAAMVRRLHIKVRGLDPPEHQLIRPCTWLKFTLKYYLSLGGKSSTRGC